MDSAGGLLSLKWNNHSITFTEVLSHLRDKKIFSDATIACDGKMFPVHKLVLSTCSDYFQTIFQETDCRRPVIVLKDIKHTELDALLNYMYIGEVNVLQTELSGLIQAAECLRIKGLAVADEPTSDKNMSRREDVDNIKRQKSAAPTSPESKRRKTEYSGSRRDNSDFCSKPKHSSPSQNTLLQSNITKNLNNGKHHLQRSIDKEVLLDLPLPVKNEAVSPKHELLDSFEDPFGASFGEPPPNDDQPLPMDDGVSCGLEELLEDNSQRRGGSLQIEEGEVSTCVISELPPSDVSNTSLSPNLRHFTSSEQSKRGCLMSAIQSSLGVQDGGSVSRWVEGEHPLGSMTPFLTASLGDGERLTFTNKSSLGQSPFGMMQCQPVRSFVCDLCGRRFNQKHHLQHHKFTHTGERPYACPHCDLTFTQTSSRNKHVKTVHASAAP